MTIWILLDLVGQRVSVRRYRIDVSTEREKVIKVIMKVGDIMTPSPITVGRDASFKEVTDLLIEHDIGGVPFVDDAGSLVGIIAESDLMSRQAYANDDRSLLSRLRRFLTGRSRKWVKKASALTAGEIMSPKVLTATPSESLPVVARRLMDHGVGRLPVVDDDRLVGIIVRRDLLRPYHRGDDEIANDVKTLLDDRVIFEQGHNVAFAVSDGLVTLTGTITYPRDVSMLKSTVGGVPGVVQVNNEVTATASEPRLDMPTRGLDGPPVI